MNYARLKKGDKIGLEGRTGILLSDAVYKAILSKGWYEAKVRWKDGQEETIVINRIGLRKLDKKRTYFQNLEEVPKLKKVGDEPIFYHPDECDCIKCLARREPGGLEYDPSNDDEEFEEHERQVFRDKGISEKENK